MVVRIIKKGNSIVQKKVEPTVHKVFKVGKREANIREKKAISNLVKLGKKAPALRASGYPESMAKNPQYVFNKPEVQNEMKVVISKLEEERLEILERMKVTRGKANYGTLAMALSIVNKDIELLSGKPTERTGYVLPEEEKKHLDKLLEMNRKK